MTSETPFTTEELDDMRPTATRPAPSDELTTERLIATIDALRAKLAAAEAVVEAAQCVLADEVSCANEETVASLRVALAALGGTTEKTP